MSRATPLTLARSRAGSLVACQEVLERQRHEAIDGISVSIDWPEGLSHEFKVPFAAIVFQYFGSD
jgi:hypothetical protein